jgi:DNA-binding NtrC family response regulator
MEATVSDKEKIEPAMAGHGPEVPGGTTSGEMGTYLPPVELSTINGAIAMESNRERAEPNLLNLLIVDDERSIREGCRDVAQSIGYTTHLADNAEHAFRTLDAIAIDVVLLDLRLPGMGGLEVLKEVKRRRPETVVVVMTGYASVQSAVQAMKQGAFDYVTKPFNLEELRLILDRVLGHLQLSSENRILRQQVKSKEGFAAMIGRSPEMEKLYRIISKAAHSSHSVLILGESGTGKELVARSIHYSGPYRDKPFVAVDCGSLVPTLIESELFGYTKGAFTGALKNKEGLLQAANGGTLFLDEIGELPVDLQSKLLRVMQEKEVRPVGSTKPVSVDVRVLAATNRDLDQAVAQGTFRRDLYFRLNVLSLRIPPLRQRKQDIPLLVGHFLERLAHSTGVQRNISDEALKLMLSYEWPGNVRELENCIERACALTSGPTIHVADLPTTIQNWRQQSEQPCDELHGRRGILPIAEIEKQAILRAIEQLHGDKLEAARLLGIGKTTLYRKLKEYGELQ